MFTHPLGWWTAHAARCGLTGQKSAEVVVLTGNREWGGEGPNVSGSGRTGGARISRSDRSHPVEAGPRQKQAVHTPSPVVERSGVPVPVCDDVSASQKPPGAGFICSPATLAAALQRVQTSWRPSECCLEVRYVPATAGLSGHGSHTGRPTDGGYGSRSTNATAQRPREPPDARSARPVVWEGARATLAPYPIADRWHACWGLTGRRG